MVLLGTCRNCFIFLSISMTPLSLGLTRCTSFARASRSLHAQSVKRKWVHNWRNVRRKSTKERGHPALMSLIAAHEKCHAPALQAPLNLKGAAMFCHQFVRGGRQCDAVLLYG